MAALDVFGVELFAHLDLGVLVSSYVLMLILLMVTLYKSVAQGANVFIG